MQNLLNGYAGFVLPTLRETFGMVYVEALFSGVPILYSQERGVDGFFDDEDIGIRCDPTSVESVTKGLREMLAGAPRMKTSLALLQEMGYFDSFRTSEICRTYQNLVSGITALPMMKE